MTGCADLKVWWRFVESEPSVDQEFFYQLPRRRHSALVRTESGGFRYSPKELLEKSGLLIQGTSFVSPEELAALVSWWVNERPSRICLRAGNGEFLELYGRGAEDLAQVENAICRLAAREDAPLRISAEEMSVGERLEEARGCEEGSLQVDRFLEGMVLTSG